MIRISSRALREIDEILDYIAAENPRASAAVKSAIQQAMEWIAKHPLMSPIVHGHHIRCKLLPRCQYRIFYSIDGPDVLIRNVRSTRRLRPWEKR